MVMILVFFLITFIVTVGEFMQNTYYAAGNRNSFSLANAKRSTARLNMRWVIHTDKIR